MELTGESPKQFEVLEEQLTLGEEKTSAVNRSDKICMKALETFFFFAVAFQAIELIWTVTFHSEFSSL